jgi:tRNA A-37 threonylcarbamoyl transferase component Bud32
MPVLPACVGAKGTHGCAGFWQERRGGTVASEVQPGGLVGGRYRLGEVLGAGGFGQVWKAHDTSLGVDVAIKQMHLDSRLPEKQRAELLTRATREARNAARLRDHPHIVSVHDVVEIDDAPWIVMQLVEGRSLADKMSDEGPLLAAQVVEIAQALLRALISAHEAGVVHRDIKPANVLLSGGGQVLLADFGISVGRGDTRLTGSALVIGSPGFIAPERLRGERGDAKSDLFALGVTLYAAAEGALPFPAHNPVGALTDQPDLPERAKGNLAKLLTALLEKDPAVRPSASQALAILASEPASGPAPDAPKKRRTPPGKTAVITNTQAELRRKYHDGGTSDYWWVTVLLMFPAGFLAWKLFWNDWAFEGEFPRGVATLIAAFAFSSALTRFPFWARGAFAVSDVVTIDQDGIGFARKLKGESGLTTYRVQWNSLKNIDVEKGRVVAWFNERSEPKPAWRSSHGISEHESGGFCLYDAEYSYSTVSPKRFQKDLKKFAGAVYGRPSGAVSP